MRQITQTVLFSMTGDDMEIMMITTRVLASMFVMLMMVALMIMLLYVCNGPREKETI